MRVLMCRLQSVRTVVLSTAAVGLVGGLLVGASGAGGASSSVSVEGGDLVESVDVRVVNVDVVVTDRKGRPISDLTVEDFRLTEDGREVQISNFSAVARAANAQVIGGRRSADATETLAPVEPLSVAIYIDERNIVSGHRQRVLTDLEAFLKKAPFGDARFVVMSYKEGLEILAGPTRDPAETIAALKAAEPSAQSSQERVAMRMAMSSVQDAYNACEAVGGGGGGDAPAGPAGQAAQCSPCEDMWYDMINFARRYSEVEHGRTAEGVSAMAEVVSVLAGIDGRKTMLYVGDGYQQRAGHSVFSYLADLCVLERPNGQNEIFREVLDYDSSRRFDQLAAFANANRVSIYMLDAAGIRAGESISVDFASTKFRPSNQNDRLYVDNIQSSHSFISNETGGEAILNANRPLEALDNMVADLDGGSYSLGFVPSHGPTGQVHRLNVQVTKDVGRGGVRVRFRKSYHDKRLSERLADKLFSTLHLDTANDQLGLAARVLEPTSAGDRWRVPVEIKIPAEAVLLVPEGEAQDETGQVRVWMSSIGDRHERGEMRQKYFDLGLGRQMPVDGFYRIVVNMELVPGTHTIAVGVRDEVSGREGYARLAAGIKVGPDESAAVDADEP